MLRNKTLAELNYILTGREDYISVINNAIQYFVDQISPKNMNFGDSKNVVVRYEVEFEQLCIALMANGVPDPSTMTVFRFYAALSYFEGRNSKKPTLKS